MSAPGRRHLYIEASALATTHQSGVGHAIRGLVSATAYDAVARSRYRLTLLVPLRGAPQLVRQGLGAVERRTIPLPMRGYDRWSGMPWMPPLDVALGDGIYVFPNFGNWPLLRSPSVTIIHDLAFLLHPETVERRTLVRLRANARTWVRHTSLVVTPSEFISEQVHRLLGVAQPRLAVVPWGVDTATYHRRTDAEVATVLSRLGLPFGYVLHLGNVEPRKNLVRLIRAYRRLAGAIRAEHPLVLVGGSSWNDGAIDAEISAAQRDGESVMRLRERVSDEDVPALLSGAALLANPSLYEGFGLVPLQAMACGTPVLASSASAMPEVDGTAALLVDPLSEDAITAGLESMLTDTRLRRRLVADGANRAAGFTWARSATAFLAALERIDQRSAA